MPKYTKTAAALLAIASVVGAFVAGSASAQRSRTFDDVPSGSYYEDAAYWAVDNAITTGCGDDKFCPDTPLTRAQMITFLHRYHKALGGGSNTSVTTTTAPPTTTTTTIARTSTSVEGDLGDDIAGWRYNSSTGAGGVAHTYTSSQLSNDNHEGKYFSIEKTRGGTCNIEVGNAINGFKGDTRDFGFRFSAEEVWRWVKFDYLLSYGRTIWLPDWSTSYSTLVQAMRDAEPGVMEWFTGTLEYRQENKVDLTGVNRVLDVLGC